MPTSKVAKSLRVFRLTLGGDTSNTEFILFNDPNDSDFKDTEKENAFATSFKRADPEGIGNNQGAEKDDGNVQALGIVEGTYTIEGFISNMRGDADDGVNAFVDRLRLWKEGAQELVGVWEAGRFGIIDNSDHDNDLAPIGTGNTAIGLIFQNFEKTNNYNENRVMIKLTFRRSRGLDF